MPSFIITFMMFAERLAGWLCAGRLRCNAIACQKVEESRRPDWRASADCFVPHWRHYHCSDRSALSNLEVTT